MRLFCFLLFSISALSSCSQPINKKTVNLYIAGCDSIFYCSEATLIPSTLIASKKYDTVFIATIFSSSEGIKVLIKPFGGTCGGVGETLQNVTTYLTKRKIEFIVSEPDSAERLYFNDISLQQAVKEIYKSSQVNKETGITAAHFEFIVRNDGALLINYVSGDGISKGIFTNSFNKTDVIKAIDTIEQANKTTIAEDNVIIKGDGNAPFAGFKILKDALRSKGVYRFKFESTTRINKPAPTVEEPPYIQKETDLSIVIAGNDILYCYHGSNCSRAKKVKLSELNVVLKQEMKSTKTAELMIMIKSMPGASFKSIIDVLDKIAQAGTPAKHYAETDITENEINCIEKLTINK